jgi:hypothetical protein
MCCAYIPPSNSSHHALYDCELFRVLENSIITYSTKGKVCLVGDLNSRTADYDDVITDDSVHSSLMHFDLSLGKDLHTTLSVSKQKSLFIQHSERNITSYVFKKFKKALSFNKRENKTK